MPKKPEIEPVSALLARTIWTTVYAGREHARAGRTKEAHDSCYALLQLAPEDLPASLVRLIQDGINDIYRITGTVLPLQSALRGSLALGKNAP